MLKPRKYQLDILNTCKEKNCLVVLPTGTGKTLIALMLAVERIKKYPASKILFLAPTRPLADQHLEYFKKQLSIGYDCVLFTGRINADERKNLWQNNNIIFSTPQCLANDLRNMLYNLRDTSLLIEDEAHRCIKNYDYTYVAEKYKEQALNPHIIGLTASPGYEKNTVKEICKNLGIEAVEVRTRQSEDVKKYLQKIEFETIELEFPSEFESMRKPLKELYDRKIQELRNRKLLFAPATKKNLLDLQHNIMKRITTGERNFNYLAGAGACATAIKLQHALELLETQTLHSLNNYLQELLKQANSKKSRSVQQLVKQKEFNQAYTSLMELLALKKEHPKLGKIKELVEQEINENKRSKIIVFSQYRDSVTRICKELNTINGVIARVFVGQAKKGLGKDSTGLSQREQKELLDEFSLGKINVIVSTSIHPDEYIVVKKETRIFLEKIGKFVDRFLNNDEKTKRIEGYEALTSDGERILFAPITHVHKHPSKKNCAKVQLNSGFDCFITKDHSLFSFNKSKKFIPSIPEMNKFVSLALNCPNIENNKKIDVFKEINKSQETNTFGTLHNLNQAKIRILKTDFEVLTHIKGEEKSIIDLSKLSKKYYSTVSNCIKRCTREGIIFQKREKRNFRNMSTLTEKGSNYVNFLKWFFENVKYYKGKYRFKFSILPQEDFNRFFEKRINVNYGKVNFPRLIELNESIARFLGFYVSEGHVRKSKYTSEIFLAARKEKMQEMMQESVENGLNLKTRRNKRGIAIDAQIGYYLIKDVFKAGIGAYNKEVPEIIFTSPSNIKWEFIRAYFLGDGHQGKDKIVFTTVSRKLVTGLVLLLRMLGVKKITVFKQRHIYRLNIHESLPFVKIRDKNEKRGHTYYSLIPTALTSKKLFEKYKNYYYSNKTNSIKCRKNGKWDKQVCFDFIKDMMEEKEQPEFVYDLSISKTENFMGGTGLFIFHNSIGEEGLDLPEVNAVIFYEPVPSAIRKIQRGGRTARLMPGKLKTLITKKTRDETYYWAAFQKEKKMYRAINEINREFKDNAQEIKKEPTLDDFKKEEKTT